MKAKHYTDKVVIHVDNKKLPALSIQEADSYLNSLSNKMESEERKQVVVDIKFTDGIVLSETITINKADYLLDNIIRYHVIGIVRYKAGISNNGTIKLNSNVDIEFYKQIYEYYSMYYTKKTFSKYEDKNINKYQKLINKRLKKISELNKEIEQYEKIISDNVG